MGNLFIFMPHFDDIFYVTFKTDESDEITLRIDTKTANKMKTGQRGLLSYKCDFFIDFNPIR